MQNYDVPLHDIKTIVEVQEYSLYYLIGTISLVLILACGIFYLVYNWLKNKNKYNKRKEHLKLLKAVDLKDAKKSAYLITLYGATFKDDGERHTQMFHNLQERLEAYKYKKEVDEIDEETRGYIELFREMCDV